MHDPELPRNRNPLRRLSAIAMCLVTLLAGNAIAVDIEVTTTADSGTGSLREAFTTAASGDRIVFNIPGTPTITLLSDLPTVAGDISFANSNAVPVTIDRNGTAALDFQGSLVDPTVLVINTGGVASPDADIVMGAGSTVFGNGDVTGNLEVPGTIAPGSDANAGTVGTLNVTGNLDVSGATTNLDLSATGGTTTSDLINVVGIADVSGATLAPNFVGDEFAIGQTFLVLDTTNPIVGTFANQASIFALPNNPFLQAVADSSLGTDDFGFAIEDNGNSFASVAIGCNQLSAASLLDQLAASGTPPSAITPLRNGSTAEVQAAYNQLSGSIYPSLIGAEINHIQNNLESVRDRAALQFQREGERMLTPWVRGYGVAGKVDQDDCNTLGYYHEIGGVELGCGLSSGGGLSAHTFAHLAGSDLNTRGVVQQADIESYRLGGLVEYVGNHLYLIAAGGAGTQNYRVRRSLTALDGSNFAESSFDGSSQFGYFEVGTNHRGPWAPYLALHTTRVELDSITETGDADFALINGGGAGDSLRGILGVSLDRSGITPVGVATARLRFGWMHEYGNASETFVSQVANTGSLTDIGVDPGIDWGFVRTQVDMGYLLGGQFTAAYEGQFNSDSSFNAFLAGTRWIY